MPLNPERRDALALLRTTVGAVCARNEAILPFEVGPVDGRLADGGLALGGLHEIAPATSTLTDDAAATLFAVGIAARAAAGSGRRVLWALTRFDLYAPGLEQAGLTPATLLFVEVRDDKDVLAVMEDGLRHGGLAAVIGEVKRADMVATRRLQLAAADSVTPAILARRWRKTGVCPLETLSAAMTRWRIASLPSERLQAPGVGRGRWRVELVRQRSGPPFTIDLEACDDTGRLALSAAPRHRETALARATAHAA